MSADRIPASHRIALLADISDGECRDGPPAAGLVLQQQGYVLVKPIRTFAASLFGGEPANALGLFTTVAWVAMLLSRIGLATSWWTRPRAAPANK